MKKKLSPSRLLSFSLSSFSFSRALLRGEDMEQGEDCSSAMGNWRRKREREKQERREERGLGVSASAPLS